MSKWHGSLQSQVQAPEVQGGSVCSGLVAFCLTVLFLWTFPPEANYGLVMFIPTLCILLYCYFSLLCSLKQPGPGEREERRGGNSLTSFGTDGSMFEKAN